MANRKKVFISFQYQDLGLKKQFVNQMKTQEIPVRFVDKSLREKMKNDDWIPEAQRNIQDCDVFVAIQGPNAFQADGVTREVSVAKGLGKPRFQLKHKSQHGPKISGAGDSIPWKWDNLIPWFTIDKGRKGKN